VNFEYFKPRYATNNMSCPFKVLALLDPTELGQSDLMTKTFKAYQLVTLSEPKFSTDSVTGTDALTPVLLIK